MTTTPIPSIRTTRTRFDRKTSFHQDEHSKRTMAAVAQFYQDRLKVKPSGSVTLRRALTAYWLQLQAIEQGSVQEGLERCALRQAAKGAR